MPVLPTLDRPINSSLFLLGSLGWRLHCPYPHVVQCASTEYSACRDRSSMPASTHGETAFVSLSFFTLREPLLPNQINSSVVCAADSPYQKSSMDVVETLTGPYPAIALKFIICSLGRNGKSSPSIIPPPSIRFQNYHHLSCLKIFKSRASTFKQILSHWR